MKNSKSKIEEFIRVDHAGERGAVKIYEGQLLALNTLVKDESLKKTIEEMKIHEKEHCDFFENEIKKRKIQPTKFLQIMKNSKTKVEEFIRVDHAGERGAVKIYEGQLLALNTLIKDESLKKTIEEMKVHEKEHCEFFENEIKKRNIKPTKFLPLWDLLGVGLGFGSTILGKKAAMLCTASVEEVIDKHYQSQINQLGPEEKDLKKKIIKFRDDELHHKDIAYEKGATKKGLYSIMDKIIKTGSKLAINISEKI